MNEPVTRFGSARTIGRGMRVAPALSHGLSLTFGFAFLGTGARLVIPILIQQSIDHGPHSALMLSNENYRNLMQSFEHDRNEGDV